MLPRGREIAHWFLSALGFLDCVSPLRLLLGINIREYINVPVWYIKHPQKLIFSEKVTLKLWFLTMVLFSYVILFLITIAFSGAFHVARSSKGLSQLETRMSVCTITNGVIIGGGRIGNLLYELNGKKDILLTDRLAQIPEVEGPIYVATRNDDLEAIIAKTPDSKLKDLVFMQNGILSDYLKKKGLCENTQCLIYLAVAKKGEPAIDGITDLNPEGLTAATGIWAEDFKARLNQGNLTCHAFEYKKWFIAMLEKHIWICAFMAVGAKYGGIKVGDVESTYNAEVRSLINELASAATLKTKVEFPSGLEDRLCAYARSVAHFPTALKEFEWRNGWFMKLTFDRVSNMKPDPCPTHTDIMESQNFFRKARKDWVAATAKAQSELRYAMYMDDKLKADEIRAQRESQTPVKLEPIVLEQTGRIFDTISPTVRMMVQSMNAKYQASKKDQAQ